jgi:hypothetical protein
MKTRVFSLSFYITITFLVSLLACKKSDQAEAVNSFTWTYEDSNYIANFRTAYISSISITGPIIIAGTGNSIMSKGTGPSITIPSLNVGSYPIGANPNNQIQYIDDEGFALQSIAGTINITENTGSRLSGNFTATIIDATSVNHSLTGIFTQIPIEQ